MVQVPAQGFSSFRSLKVFQTLWRLHGARRKCRLEMKRAVPDVLLAMGSYASVGPCAAAVSLGVPVVLHEANVIPGRAVRLLSRRAVAVAVGFEETRFHLSNAQVEVVGVPLREELILSARAMPPREAAIHHPFRLLIAGGSMGAHKLNEIAMRTLPGLAKKDIEIQVMHLTGREDEAAVRTAYEAAGIPADVSAFTTNMAPLYHTADLAICRAGASTCAELAFFGVPALFVPYPFAAMDHQMENARALEKRGTSDVVAETALTSEWLEAYLTEMISRPERLARLREAARKEGVRDGTQALAALVERCARSS
jgi:UDP-N-acetylglucosamine--N-acetylmuramyl-(pentapeptide) pyrophosphoryl-undecaprenol N-acetylglucosamine transferase